MVFLVPARDRRDAILPLPISVRNAIAALLVATVLVQACSADGAPLTEVPSSGPITIDSLTRDVGSTAGGATLYIKGSGYQSGAVVMFGEARSSTVTVNSTTIRATVPPGSVGLVPVSVIQGTASAVLPASFEYLPAPTRTYFSNNFEGPSLAPLFNDWNPTQLSTDFAVSGTTSVLGSMSKNGGAGVQYNFVNPANPALTPEGVYLRFYVYMPTSSVDNVLGTGGQVKLNLFRATTALDKPAWLMCGVGYSFGSSRKLVCFVDYGISPIPGGYTNATLGDGQWVEIESWQQRTSGVGRVRLWINGKRQFDYSHANFGVDDSSIQYGARFGLTYTQSPLGPVNVYLDNVAAANGFIDP